MSGQYDDMSAEAEPRSNQDRERRITLHALKTWTDARKRDKIPYLANLFGITSLAGEQKEFTENQFLIMFDINLKNSVVIFYGSELPKLVGQRKVDTGLQRFLPAALAEIFSDACKEAINNCAVIECHGMINTPSGVSVLYRSIFMPLRSEKEHPNYTYVFGAFSNEGGGRDHHISALIWSSGR